LVGRTREYTPALPMGYSSGPRVRSSSNRTMFTKKLSMAQGWAWHFLAIASPVLSVGQGISVNELT
jgi:hypothetical protein